MADHSMGGGRQRVSRPIFSLEMRNTENWSDVRYRAYTTSAAKAAQFYATPKIRFTDSGHGIVPSVSSVTSKKLPPIHLLAGHVRAALAKAVSP